eukprot:scaffold429_cov269-Pinguiococcus_pyrenoidosus.AAC.23
MRLRSGSHCLRSGSHWQAHHRCRRPHFTRVRATRAFDRSLLKGQIDLLGQAGPDALHVALENGTHIAPRVLGQHAQR